MATKPSGRAIAQALEENFGKYGNFTHYPSIMKRARELDATAAPVVVGEDIPWVDDETRLTVTLKQLMKDRPLYLMGREHANEPTKSLAEIKFGMVSGLGVLFCMADTEAPIPSDPSLTAALAGD